MPGKSVKPVILLVEHDEDDVFFFKRALAQARPDSDLHVCFGVDEAKELLRVLTPDFLICDYQFCGHTAVSFVQWVRGNSALSAVPVVIWSGAASRVDRAQFAGLEVSEFVSKGVESSDLRRWLEAKLPAPGAL